MPPDPIRVLLADDYALVRAGIRALLDGLKGIEVVAEAGEGRQALQLIARHQPQVVLMDISMSGLNGLDATAQLAEENPAARVIILSVHRTEEYVLQALRAGAAGYVLKDAEVGELEQAIRTVAQGGTWLSPAVSGHVAAAYLRQRAGSEERVALTPRQREIAQLIAEGHSTRQIAGILHLSEKTVETHRAQLMKALGVHEVAGVVRWAIRTGLVNPEA